MTTEILNKAQKTIDGKIAEYCRVQRITAEQFANLVGVSPQTLVNKRNGATEWKQSELLAIGDLMDLTQDELVGRSA